jgi:hypothetical protein
MKARVAAATAKVTAQESTAAPPSRPPPQQPPVFQAPNFDDFSRMEMGSGARGGLAIGIHPALLGETQDKAKKEQKAKGKSKKEDEVKRSEEVNPYISEGGTVSGRAKRSLNFTHNMNARPAMQAANEVRIIKFSEVIYMLMDFTVEKKSSTRADEETDSSPSIKSRS